MQLRSDNAAVVAYLNKQGGTKSGGLWQVAEDILVWAEANVQTLSAIHVKGSLNHVADFLSRNQLSQTEVHTDSTAVGLSIDRFIR